MSALFKIIQDGATPGFGVARRDMQFSSVAGDVTLEAQAVGVTYSWTVESEPNGSSIIVVNPTSQTATITLPDVAGGYIVRLVVDAGLETEDVSELYLGIPLAHLALCIPAFNETIQDNSEGSDYYGYERKLTAIYKALDASTGAVFWSRSLGVLTPVNAGDAIQVVGATDDILLQSNAAVVLTAGTELSFVGANITLDDANRSGSAYTTSMPVSSAQSEWDDFVTNYGDGTSFIGAMNIASLSNDVFIPGVGSGSALRRNAGNTAAGVGAFAMGSGSTASGQNSAAIGDGCIASNQYAFAQGGNAQATGISSVALGSGVYAIADYALVAGAGSTSSGAYAVSLGGGNVVAATYSFAVGSGQSLDVDSTYAAVFGSSQALTGAPYSVAAGSDNIILNGSNCLVMGDSNAITGLSPNESYCSNVLGYDNELVSGDFCTVIGAWNVVGPYTGGTIPKGCNYTFVAGQTNVVEGSDSSFTMGYGIYHRGGESSLLGGRSHAIHSDAGVDEVSANASLVWGASHEISNITGCILAGGFHKSIASSYNAIFGSYHKVEYSNSSWNILAGYSNTIQNGNSYSAIFGAGNFVGPGGGASYNFIAGQNNIVRDGSSHNTMLGQSHLSEQGGGSSVLAGTGNKLSNGAGSNYLFGTANRNYAGGSGCLIVGLNNAGLTWDVGTQVTLTKGTGDVMYLNNSVGAGYFSSAWVGKSIVISGATNAANNGSWTIVSVPSATQLEFAIPAGAGVAESGNDSLLYYYASAFATGAQYEFISGVRNMALSSSYGAVIGYNNFVVDSNYSLIVGKDHRIESTGVGEAGSYSLIAGEGHQVVDDNTHNIIAGASHQCILGVGNDYNAIFGNSHAVSGGGTNSNIVAGSSHSINVGGHRANAVFGADNGVYGGGESYNILAGAAHAVRGGCSNNALFGSNQQVNSGVNYTGMIGLTNRAASGASYSFVVGSKNGINPFNIGTTISLAFSTGTVVLTDTAGLFNPGVAGQTISINNASNSGNNGSFSNITYVSATQVSFVNASGVNETGNANLTWSIGGGSSYTMITGLNNLAFNSGGLYSIIAGKDNSAVGGLTAGLIVGQRNRVIASGGDAGIIFGEDNYAHSSSVRSLIGGQYNDVQHGHADSLVVGRYCRAQQNCELSVVTGRLAMANNHRYMHVHAGGHASDSADTATPGEAQLVDRIPHSGQTIGASITQLYLDGARSSVSWNTPNDHAFTLVTYVVAKCTAGPSSGGVKGWRLEALINNTAGTNVIVGTPTKFNIASTAVSGEGSWDVNIRVSGATIYIEATGGTSDIISWQAYTFGPEIGIA